MKTTHTHHIIPRHAGGTDDPSNLIELTVEEHAQAHKELFEKYGRWQDRIAWQMLSGQISNAEAIKQAQRESGLRCKSFLGKTHSKEARAKISQWMKENKNWIGHDMPHTEETKQIISEKLKGNSNKLGKTGKQNNKYDGPRDWLEGNSNPAKRPEVREKLRLAALRREEKRRQERLNNTNN